MSAIAAPPKFGVSQSVTRTEDPRLVAGGGRFTDDMAMPGMLHAVVVRSQRPHGRLVRVDSTAAAAAPGVRLVVTGADLVAAGYKTMPCFVPVVSKDGTPLIVPTFPALATDSVRWVGQPIAMIVADSQAAARDAAERLVIEIEELPVVTELEDAVAPGAPQLFAEMPDNVAVDWAWGPADAVAAAIDAAAHVTKVRVVNNRVVVNPMEPRGAVASFENGRWTLHTGCQGVFGLRAQLAGLLDVDVASVRVIADDIGGSFGMKASTYPEHLPLMHAARVLGLPIKWMNDRAESFLSDYHGRDSVLDGELALDAAGNFLAVRVRGLGNLGAYVTAHGPHIPTLSIQKNVAGIYKTPLMEMAIKGVVTNTVPLTAYRGAGRPEGVHLMERLVDQAARELGRDPLELRRQNLIRPTDLPYKAGSGQIYDSGDFGAVIDAGLARADWDGFAARRRRTEAQGKLRGRGVCSYLEVTAPAGKEHGGIRFGADGRVTLVSGTLDYGQGHRAAYAQLLHQRLGIPFELIDLLQGDSDQLQFGGGTGGSRSIMAAANATHAAAAEVVKKGKTVAANVLEAAEADIEFAAGTFTVAGTDRRIGIMELAVKAREQGTPLDTDLVADTPPATYPNGCHVAEVVVDPETGVVTLDRYSGVDDFGTLVNPMLVEGQVHGGVVQGIGQALHEHTVYDPAGQLLSGSFMDYCMPRADDLPLFDVGFHIVPAKTNELGVKGCGEAGVSAAPPAIMNAILDALAPLGVTHLDMPATPSRVWTAIQAARPGLKAAE